MSRFFGLLHEYGLELGCFAVSLLFAALSFFFTVKAFSILLSL